MKTTFDRIKKLAEVQDQQNRLAEAVESIREAFDNTLKCLNFDRALRQDVNDHFTVMLKPLQERLSFIRDWADVLTLDTITDEAAEERAVQKFRRAFGFMGDAAWVRQNLESHQHFVRLARDEMEVMRGERAPEDALLYSESPDDPLHRYVPFNEERARERERNMQADECTASASD